MKKVWMILLLVVLLALPVHAETDTVFNEQYYVDRLDEVMDSLDSETQSVLERWGITPEGVFSGEEFSLQELWKIVSQLLIDIVKNPLSAGVSSAGIILLCSLLRSVTPENNTGMNSAMEYFSAVCLGVVLMVPVGYVLSKTASAISTVGNFMMAFIPVYAGILISAGRSLTANGAGSLVFGCSQFLVYLSENLLLPFLGMFLSLSLCRSASGELNIDGFTAAFKKTAVWILGLATTLFSALLSITGVINGAGDSLSQRTSRYFIGNMVPIIGGTLSETLGTVQGCLSLLKTGGGVLGLGAVSVLFLPTLLEILLWRGGLMLLTALSELMETHTITRLLRAVGEGIGLLLSLVVCCFVVYMVSLAVMAIAGGSGG